MPATDDNSNLTVDFGFYELGSIGNLVWIDTDRDGVQDSGEPGVPGVTVNLLDSTGKVIATTTTAADGSYVFVDLVPGNYAVEFDVTTLPEGMIVTGANKGGDEALDSDGDAAGKTGTWPVGPGTHRRDVDLGIHIARVDLTIEKSLAGTLAAGSDATWTIVVKSNGPDAHPGPITMTDTLPDDLAYVQATGDGWACTAAGQALTCVTKSGLADGAQLPTINVVTKVSTVCDRLHPQHRVGPAAGEDRQSDNNTTVASATLGSVARGPLGPLAFTGRNMASVVIMGFSLCALGALLLVARRRSLRHN